MLNPTVGSRDIDSPVEVHSKRGRMQPLAVVYTMISHLSSAIQRTYRPEAGLRDGGAPFSSAPCCVPHT
jgi:hypothetical protein